MISSPAMATSVGNRCDASNFSSSKKKFESGRSDENDAVLPMHQACRREYAAAVRPSFDVFHDEPVMGGSSWREETHNVPVQFSSSKIKFESHRSDDPACTHGSRKECEQSDLCQFEVSSQPVRYRRFGTSRSDDDTAGSSIQDSPQSVFSNPSAFTLGSSKLTFGSHRSDASSRMIDSHKSDDSAGLCPAQDGSPAAIQNSQHWSSSKIKFESRRSNDEAVLPSHEASRREMSFAGHDNLLPISSKMSFDGQQPDDAVPVHSRLGSWKEPFSDSPAPNLSGTARGRLDGRGSIVSLRSHDHLLDAMERPPVASRIGSTDTDEVVMLHRTSLGAGSGDRHSSPGIMTDIPWGQVDDLTSHLVTAVGSFRELSDVTATVKPSPAGSPRHQSLHNNTVSKRVHLAMTPQAPISGDGTVQTGSTCAAPDRPPPYGNRGAKSDRQLLDKNKETMVGRGRSFPMLSAGVFSAEPSGEWWSPAALRDRLKSSHLTKPQSNSESAAADGLSEDLRPSNGNATEVWRPSVFQNQAAQDVVEKESVHQRPGSKVRRHTTSNNLPGLLAPIPPSHQLPAQGRATVRPPIGEARSHDVGNVPDADKTVRDKGASTITLRREAASKLAALRASRRNPRASMSLLGIDDKTLEEALHEFKSHKQDPASPASDKARPSAALETAGASPASRLKLPSLVYEGKRH